MAKTNVPRLRFRGFDKEWQSGNIGNKLNVVMGQSPHSEKYTFDSNQNILVQGNADISNGKISPRIYTSEITRVSKKNEIIMTVRAPVGELALNQFDNVVIGRGVAALSGNSFDYFLLDRINKMGIWNRFSSGSTFDAVNSNDIKSMSIRFPQTNEQERIGLFFKKIDNLIELQTQKLEQLKKIKQGYLQKMFPQNGQSVPRLRFSGFNDEWKEKKLNEVADRVTRKNKGLDSDLPLTISAQYGLIDQETFFNKKVASKDLSNYFLVKRGEFAYNKSYSNGYPFGTIKSLKKYDKGVLSSLYIVFAIKKNISHLFMDSFFDSNHWHKEVSVKTTEGARNHGLLNISPKDFMDSKILLPHRIEEQQKIGAFFSKLDQMIKDQSNKIEALKQQKKAYLQKMFI